MVFFDGMCDETLCLKQELSYLAHRQILFYNRLAASVLGKRDGHLSNIVICLYDVQAVLFSTGHNLTGNQYGSRPKYKAVFFSE